MTKTDSNNKLKTEKEKGRTRQQLKKERKKERKKKRIIYFKIKCYFDLSTQSGFQTTKSKRNELNGSKKYSRLKIKLKLPTQTKLTFLKKTFK